tara:strand:+ start:250 stop:831 length:582 start_codon:yes stop_codon:yes gene_type:complete
MINDDSISFMYNDGGRANAGRKGYTGDCVARAIAIAAGLPYQEVYDRMAEGNVSQRRSKHDKSKRSRTASHGIAVKRKWFKDYMRELGFVWTATMEVGSGCKVHLKYDELPKGRIVVSLSRHYAAVLNGVLHDTHDCSRGGTRCVYGYWSISEERVKELRAEREASTPKPIDPAIMATVQNLVRHNRLLFGSP